jgi:hypothetical protein
MTGAPHRRQCVALRLIGLSHSRHVLMDMGLAVRVPARFAISAGCMAI